MSTEFYYENAIYFVNDVQQSTEGMAKMRCEYLTKRRIDFVLKIFTGDDTIVFDKNKVPEKWTIKK